MVNDCLPKASHDLIMLVVLQVDKWAEKQEAAKERKEAKQREKQQQKPEKQAAPSAEALARLDCPMHARFDCNSVSRHHP